MKISEVVLLDTNVLVYAHSQSSKFHLRALKIIQEVIEGKIKGVLAQQNLLEFYSIMTDPKRVSLPLSSKEIHELITGYLGSPFKIIHPKSETTEIALTLGSNLKAKAGKIFDIYLYATIISNNIKTIVTANVKDFKDFPKLKVIDLASLD